MKHKCPNKPFICVDNSFEHSQGRTDMKIATFGELIIKTTEKPLVLFVNALQAHPTCYLPPTHADFFSSRD